MFKYRFCYMVDARAKLGTDFETGEPCEVYMQVTPEFEAEVPVGIQEEMHQLYGKYYAEELLNIKPEYTHPISNEEYDANTDDESEEGESLEVILQRED